MIPVCGIPSLVLFALYGLAGVLVSIRLLRHGKNGTPTGWLIYDEEAYTPEGQRLLRFFLRWWGWIPLLVTAFLLVFGGSALCWVIAQ